MLELLKRYPKMEPLLVSGRPTFNFKEVFDATGFTERRIANRIAKGELKAPPRGENLVLKKSLIPWLLNVPPARQKGKILELNRERNRA